MIKPFASLLLALVTITVSAQTHQINGEVVGKPQIGDTIYLKKGVIADKYYTQSLDSAKLTGSDFVLNKNVSYPQMYRVWFATDRNVLAWRQGIYFIDSSTTKITVNYKADKLSKANGSTAEEYNSKFISFMTEGVDDDKRADSLNQLLYDPNKKADELLLKYVTANPSSYVALWELVERFSNRGQSALREQVLSAFSAKLKSEQVWHLLNEDFKNAKIKENAPFPIIAVKDLKLAPVKLVFPKAKYTLIDYWFCRCLPCLQAIPQMQKIYATYKNKGFDIVSISVDETVNVPLWQKRVKEHSLTWTQYLEENNFRTNELGITSFPTFILLNSEGKVIWKNFDLDELEKFLKEKV